MRSELVLGIADDLASLDPQRGSEMCARPSFAGMHDS